MDLSYDKNQAAVQEENVQILYRWVSVYSTGDVFADMNLKGEGYDG